MVDKDTKAKLFKFRELLPEKDNLYDREVADKLVVAAEAEFSAQNIDDFKQIVPIIKNKMKDGDILRGKKGREKESKINDQIVI